MSAIVRFVLIMLAVLCTSVAIGGFLRVKFGLTPPEGIIHNLLATICLTLFSIIFLLGVVVSYLITLSEKEATN